MLLIDRSGPCGAGPVAQLEPGAFGRGVGVKRRHDSCNECGLIHRLSTGCPSDAEASWDPEVDIMDVPDLFLAIDAPDAQETALLPQPRRQRRLRGAPPSGLRAVRTKDSSVHLPEDPVMSGALRVAERRADIVTSGREGSPGDGVHSFTSQHYSGTAIDVRYAARRAEQIAAYARLGYVVVPEATHIHIQAYPVRA